MTGEKEKETNPAELPLLLSDGTGQALKPKPKILKKSLHNNLPIVEKKTKIVLESLLENNRIEKDDIEKRQKPILNLREELDNKNPESQKPIVNRRSLQTKKVNWKKNTKPRGLDKLKSRKNKEKSHEVEMNQWKEQNSEKLGGLIFMCSAKTKPDCFRYGVMGVPMSKKELVLSVRPGFKLFLYDFEQRLMYGIYEAVSSGGFKLEPKAFDGAFPFQVRFRVHEDCYPLTESVFREAIKENYNKKHHFEHQLTVKQVNRLVELFQRVELHSEAPATGPQPIMTVQNRDNELRHYNVQPREDHLHISHRGIPVTERDEMRQNTFLTEQEYRTYGLRRERPNLSQLSAIDPHLQDAVGRHYLSAHKEDLLAENGDLRQTNFLTEKEYRTYGLRKERPHLTTSNSHIVSGLEEAYPKSVVREDLLRQQSVMYPEFPSQRGEPSHYHPIIVNERGHRDYGVSTNKDLLQYQHYGYGSDKDLPGYSLYVDDPYSTTSRRDEVLSSSHTLGREAYTVETNHLSGRGIHDIDRLMRGSDDMERLYSTYASRDRSDYDRDKGAMLELSNAPVSFGYSYSGPSLS